MSQSVTIGMIGHFPNPYTSVIKKHADRISGIDGRWGPDSEDFRTVLLQSKKAKGLEVTETQNFGEFLVSLAFSYSKKNNAYTRRPAGSVSRVDLISHGNSSELALDGTIEPFDPEKEPLKKLTGMAQINFTTTTPTNLIPKTMNLFDYFNEYVFNEIEDRREYISASWAKKDSKGKTISQGPQVTFDDCLKSFAKDGRLVCYLCKSAVKPNMLQGLADLLEIEVGGFATKIKYTYVSGKGISLSFPDDNGVKHGKPSFDYRDLDVADVFKVFKPQPKSKK